MVFLTFNKFSVLIFFNLLHQVLLFQCKDQNNFDVDWYIVYKLPKMAGTGNQLIRDGVAYVYMDENKNWTYPGKNMKAQDSPLEYTLAQLYDKQNADKSLWVMYNNHPPAEPSKTWGGHTKGVLMVNEEKGFWLIHSMMRYPWFPSYGQYGRTTKKPSTNGENWEDADIFMCISFLKDQFNTIGKQLMYNEIVVYRKNVPDILAQQFQTLADAVNEKKNLEHPFYNKEILFSTKKKQLISFAKSSKWIVVYNKYVDLYKDYLGKEFKDNLEIVTFRRGECGIKLPDCDTFCNNVYHVYSINFQKIHLSLRSVTSPYEMSKWAVTADYNKIFCIADLNRSGSNSKRGGGAVCINDERVWSNFHEIIQEIDRCKKPRIDQQLDDWRKDRKIIMRR